MTIWRVEYDDCREDKFFANKKEAICAVINSIMAYYDDLDVAMSEIKGLANSYDANPDDFCCDLAYVSEVHVV